MLQKRMRVDPSILAAECVSITRLQRSVTGHKHAAILGTCLSTVTLADVRTEEAMVDEQLQQRIRQALIRWVAVRISENLASSTIKTNTY